METPRGSDVIGSAMTMINFSDIVYHPLSPSRPPNMFQNRNKSAPRPTPGAWKDRYRPASSFKRFNPDHCVTQSPVNLFCSHTPRVRSSYASTSAAKYSSITTIPQRRAKTGNVLHRNRKLGDVNPVAIDENLTKEDLLIVPDINVLIDLIDEDDVENDYNIPQQGDPFNNNFRNVDYLSPRLSSSSHNGLSSASIHRSRSGGLIRGYDNYQPQKRRVATAWGERGQDVSRNEKIRPVSRTSMVPGGSGDGVFFDRYNWHQRAQELEAERFAHNRDLERRRDMRTQRTRPWRRSAPASGASSASVSSPASRVSSGVVKRETVPPSSPTMSKVVTERKTPEAPERKPPPNPFTSRTEAWLQSQDVPIWVKHKGRDPKPDRQRFIIMEEKVPVAGAAGKDGESEPYGHIGPHRDFYEKFNEEKLHMDEEERATIVFQRFLRGYIVRHRFRVLKERVILKHAGTFKRFVREYKGLLTRIQKRNEAKKIITPFVLADVNRFLTRKEKYEKIFFNMAIADKIPRNMLKHYFRECGINPDDRTINQAYTDVFKGCGAKAEIIFLVDCSASVGSNNFKTQRDFVKEFVTCLHVGEGNVRVGYVPYNTDVYQSFDLDMHGDVESIFNGIDHVRYHKGFTRTDRALAKMREMFKVGRKAVPKIGILITDGKSDDSAATDKEATEARTKDGVQLFAVGVGKSVDMTELIIIAGGRQKLFHVPDYFSLWRAKTAIMKKAKLINCEFCHWVAPTDLQVDTARGLYREEVLEIIWQMYAPGGPAIGKNYRKMPITDEELLAYRKKTLKLIEGKEAYYSTSLNFAIRSKLEKDGFAHASKMKGLPADSSWSDSVGAAEKYLNAEKHKKFIHDQEEEKRKSSKKTGGKKKEKKSSKGK